MKNQTLVILVAIIATVTSAATASTVEFDLTAGKSQIQMCIEQPISGKVGGFAYSCQSESWGETYVGLTYAPIANIQVAFGAGQETGGSRTGGWIWAGKDRFSGIYFLENGASGTWDKLVLKYKTTNKLSLGWVKKQFAGSGIYAEFKLSKEATVKYSGFKEPELALQLSF